MLVSLAERPVAARLIGSLLFLLVAGTLALPFVAVSVDERRAEASGLELAEGEAELTGRYVHAAYEGQAEEVVDEARGPAVAVAVAALAGIGLVWLPGRAGLLAGAALAGLALLGLAGIFRTAASSLDLADADLRAGFGLAVIAAAGALAWSSLAASRALFWWRPKPPPARDYFPER